MENGGEVSGGHCLAAGQLSLAASQSARFRVGFASVISPCKNAGLETTFAEENVLGDCILTCWAPPSLPLETPMSQLVHFAQPSPERLVALAQHS